MEKSTLAAVRKGAWTAEEDNLLRKCIDTFGEGKWHLVPVRAGLNRCRKSCRLRWLNYLKPDIKRGEFSEDEVDLIIRMHKLLGNRWSLIAGRLPGRKQETHEAGETSKAITRSNIIRPRPWKFCKYLTDHVNPNHVNSTDEISGSWRDFVPEKDGDQIVNTDNNAYQTADKSAAAAEGHEGVEDDDEFADLFNDVDFSELLKFSDEL